MRRRDRVRRASQAVQVFDQMLEFFGEDGAHWLQGRMHDTEGRRCLVGALDDLCARPRVLRLAVWDFLEAAISTPQGGGFVLTWYNDRARSFADVRALILKARALALEQADDPAPERLAA